MKSIAKKTFTSPINVDTGTVSIPQGDHESTMELFAFPGGGYQIEWDIPSLETTEHMNIEVEHRTVTGYDGVFELPLQAIELLEENGFNCDQMREDMELPAKIV